MRAVSVGLLAFVVGCGPGALDGELLGAPVEVKSAIFGVARHIASGNDFVGFMISDDPDICEKLTNKVGLRSTTLQFSVMIRTSDDGKNVLPFLDGEYAVSGDAKGRFARGQFLRTGENCGNQLTATQGQLKSGNMTVRGYSAGVRQFNIDVNVIVGSQEDWIRGSVAAKRCEALSALTVDLVNGTPTVGSTCD